MPWEIVVPPNEPPKRLENLLKKRFNVGYVRKLFRKNGVRLNGKRSGPEELARAGDRIQLYIPFEKQKAAPKTPRAQPFEIIFEDKDLIVIDKPAGIAVHEGKDILKRNSLLGMLEEFYRSRGIAPRLAHRIDKDTSGLLVAAKNVKTAEKLEAMFEKSAVEKEYLALVIGRLHPKHSTIQIPLPGRDGRPVSAVTHYRVEKEFTDTTLARVRIETGRMHQIRLHFAALGHPVVMDDEHGDFAFNKQFRKTYGLKRQFLHAATVAFEYRGKKRKWTSGLPDELARILKSLESSLK
jgi:23S rRNA pseudouridine955/2504/2580 synthase